MTVQELIRELMQFDLSYEVQVDGDTVGLLPVDIKLMEGSPDDDEPPYVVITVR